MSTSNEVWPALLATRIGESAHHLTPSASVLAGAL
jgi:hypothetical protein